MLGCFASGGSGGYREMTCFPFRQLYKSFLKSLVGTQLRNTKHIPHTHTPPPPRVIRARGRITPPFVVFLCAQRGFAATSLPIGHVLLLVLPVLRMLASTLPSSPSGSSPSCDQHLTLRDLEATAEALEKSKAPWSRCDQTSLTSREQGEQVFLPQSRPSVWPFCNCYGLK